LRNAGRSFGVLDLARDIQVLHLDGERLIVLAHRGVHIAERAESFGKVNGLISASAAAGRDC